MDRVRKITYEPGFTKDSVTEQIKRLLDRNRPKRCFVLTTLNEWFIAGGGGGVLGLQC